MNHSPIKVLTVINNCKQLKSSFALCIIRKVGRKIKKKHIDGLPRNNSKSEGVQRKRERSICFWPIAFSGFDYKQGEETSC